MGWRTVLLFAVMAGAIGALVAHDMGHIQFPWDGQNRAEQTQTTAPPPTASEVNPEREERSESPASVQPPESVGEELPVPPVETTSEQRRALGETLNQRYRAQRAERQAEASREDLYEGQEGGQGRTVVTHGCSSENRFCFDFPDGTYPRERALRIVDFILREMIHPGTFTVPSELIRWQYTHMVPRRGCTALESGQVCWAENPNYQDPRS